MYFWHVDSLCCTVCQYWIWITLPELYLSSYAFIFLRRMVVLWRRRERAGRKGEDRSNAGKTKYLLHIRLGKINTAYVTLKKQWGWTLSCVFSLGQVPFTWSREPKLTIPTQAESFLCPTELSWFSYVWSWHLREMECTGQPLEVSFSLIFCKTYTRPTSSTVYWKPM